MALLLHCICQMVFVRRVQEPAIRDLKDYEEFTGSYTAAAHSQASVPMAQGQESEAPQIDDDINPDDDDDDEGVRDLQSDGVRVGFLSLPHPLCFFSQTPPPPTSPSVAASIGAQ